MANHRDDVIERAIGLLDRYGLADLSMRRLAAELGVQPGALYHHFADKQTLLASVADEVLRRGDRPAARVAAVGWEDLVRAICAELRDAMLAYRDGAELVATVHAFGLGAHAPGLALEAALDAAGLDGGGDSGHPGPPSAVLRRTAVRTLLHYVFGHTADEQAHLQAAAAGALSAELRERPDFELGLSLILDGLRQHVSVLIAARVDRPAGAPADPVFAGHQRLVHETAAQRGEVGMEGFQRLVDRRLGIGPPSSKDRTMWSSTTSPQCRLLDF